MPNDLTLDTTTIRRDIADALDLSNRRATTADLRAAVARMARYAGALLLRVESAEQAHAVTLAQLGTARAALHAGRPVPSTLDRLIEAIPEFEAVEAEMRRGGGV